MAGQDDKKSGGWRWHLRDLLLGLLVGGVLFVAIRACQRDPGLPPDRPAATTWTTARVDTRLRSDPQLGNIYRTAAALYPADYRAYLVRLAAAANSRRRDLWLVEQAAFLTHLMDGHREGIARAPADQLLAIARQNRLLFSSLQRSDPELCARMLFTGTPVLESTHPVGRLLNPLTVLMIRAAHAGEQPGAVAQAPPARAEWEALHREIDRRSPGGARTLSNRAALRALPLAQQCAHGAALYEALQTLPPDAAARISAYMLYNAGRRDGGAGAGGVAQESSSARR